MIYDQKRNYCDGEWHCPFSPEWLAMMRRAAYVCERMKADEIEALLRGETLPPLYKEMQENFLSYPQDSRGLPSWYCERYLERECTATYDYESIPEVVVTNGIYDWPLEYRCGVLTA